MTSSHNTLTRRAFLQASAAGMCTAHLVARSAAAETTQSMQTNEGGIPLRSLGTTGEKVSILCLGGHHLGRVEDDADAVKLVRYAIDHGVTFIDNAWEYHHGRSENIVGRALKDGYRKKAFVMTKVHGRDKQTTRQQIEDSLRRLEVDTIDLCQAHEVIYKDDPRRLFADDGGMEALTEAKQQGKIRFVGFTGHKHPDLFVEMLRSGYDWDTLQMPVNAFDPHYRSFIKEIIPMARDKKIGVLAMKTMGSGYLLKPDVMTPEQALRFAWSQPVASVVSGMNSMDLLKENIRFARRFQPMSESEQQALLNQTQPVAKNGQWEKYKSANTFDGWYGRSIHGNEPPPIT